MIDIVIFGSCVTRDAMELVPKELAHLQRYFARSSLGSAYAKPVTGSFDITSIASNFQRGVVTADLDKEFPQYLESAEFDLLVYDPIDERFNLIEATAGGICTLSNELAQIGAAQSEAVSRIIRARSDEFYQLWEAGWSSFIQQLSGRGLLHKLRINRVFWACSTATGADFLPTYSTALVESANIFLRRLYARMEADLPLDRFYEFEPEQLVGADEHKWGLSPFHYGESYYRTLAGMMTRHAPELVAAV